MCLKRLSRVFIHFIFYATCFPLSFGSVASGKVQGKCNAGVLFCEFWERLAQLCSGLVTSLAARAAH